MPGFTQTKTRTFEPVDKIPSSIDAIKTYIDRGEKAIAAASCKELISLLESKLFQNELRGVINGCIEGVTSLTDKLIEVQLTSPAISLTYCRFNLVKKYYINESRIRRLRAIGVALQHISTCLRSMNRKYDIKKYYSLMDEILKEMQKIKTVDLKLKCIDVAWFMKFYGFCCNEADDLGKSIEINKQAIAIMETVFSEDSGRYLVLGLCYHMLGVAYDKSTKSTDARPFYQKAMSMYKNSNDWPNSDKREECVALVTRSLDRIHQQSMTSLKKQNSNI